MTIHTPSVAAPLATRIRAELDGIVVADSRKAVLFRESPMHLQYFFPASDIREGVIDKSSETVHRRKFGSLREWTVRAGTKEVPGAAIAYAAPSRDAPDLRGYIGLVFGKMDRWLEEDEELIGHPRDPYTRIDVRRSSLRIRVESRGVLLAETDRPLLLAETGLPVRYYFPEADVNWDVLEPTDTETVCPYKGRARYWSARTGDEVLADIAWAYPEPLQDGLPVRGTVGFYQEKLTVHVDGSEEPVPAVHFTK